MRSEWKITPRAGGRQALEFHKKYYKGKINLEQYLRLYTEQTLAYVLFLEFIEIRKSIVAHNRKYRDEHGADVKNRTGEDILVADINWAYDVERNTPFAVRGHWRMQRCGPGFSKVKLIWIKPFQKEGYKRKAGKRNLKEK